MNAAFHPPADSAGRRRGIRLAQAADHFAAALRHVIAGLVSIDEAGLDPSDDLAEFMADAIAVDIAATHLADTWARAETARRFNGGGTE